MTELAQGRRIFKRPDRRHLDGVMRANYAAQRLTNRALNDMSAFSV
jgi:hypothetical protein